MASDTHRGPDSSDILPFVHYNMLISSNKYLKFPHASQLSEIFSYFPKYFGPEVPKSLFSLKNLFDSYVAPAPTVAAHRGADVIEVPLAFGGPVIAHV